MGRDLSFIGLIFVRFQSLHLRPGPHVDVGSKTRRIDMPVADGTIRSRYAPPPSQILPVDPSLQSGSGGVILMKIFYTVVKRTKEASRTPVKPTL